MTCQIPTMHYLNIDTNPIRSLIVLSVEVIKEERPELPKKAYKWNTKEEAKQAFKELLKEKVSQRSCYQMCLMPS